MTKPEQEALQKIGRIFDNAIRRERAKQDKYRRKGATND
jgi:hypothetical protein